MVVSQGGRREEVADTRRYCTYLTIDFGGVVKDDEVQDHRRERGSTRNAVYLSDKARMISLMPLRRKTSNMSSYPY